MELDEGVEGLVHISELAPERVNTVTDVVKSGYTYDPGLNAETSDSVTVP